MISRAKTVTAYIEELPSDRASAIRKLRTLIRKAAPEAEESMKYGLPTYEFAGPLFALASQKQYLALYVAEIDLVASYERRLGKTDVGKSCIRFRKLDDLSLDAVAALLDAAAKRRRGIGRLLARASVRATARVTAKKPTPRPRATKSAKTVAKKPTARTTTKKPAPKRTTRSE